MLKVFLSSTFKDLEAERKAVEAAIHRMSAQYIGMEHFGSFAEEPIEKSLEKVRTADVLILLLGDRYGYLPEQSLISITEAEYQEAKKRGIPILPYFTAEKMWYMRSDTDPKLEKFKETVQKKHGISWFSTPDDLAWKVISDLAREFSSTVDGAATNVVTIQNSMLMDPIRSRVDELIAILEHRAERILTGIGPFFKYAPVQKYIKDFKKLHQRHITSLRNGNIIEAHEVLSEIHKISSDLERNEFWTSHRIERPGVKYSLRPDAFQRGIMICEYIAGEMVTYSDKYPSDSGFRGFIFGDNDLVTPVVSAELYRKILGDNTTSQAEMDKFKT